MRNNFLHNLISSVFIPSKKNKFRPFLFTGEAFYFYTLLTIITLFMVSPLCNIRIGCWTGSLTQDLIIEAVNPDRETMGFLPLQKSEKLTKAAQLKAEDMMARDYFSHVGPNGEKPWSWLDLAGYRYATAGENLAIDFSDPSILEQAWLNSPLHAQNILNGYFTDIGVGIAKGEIDGRNTAVVVMFLGREITPILEKIVEETAEEEPKITKPETLVATPEAKLATTLPQKPVITKTIEEDNLDKENLLIAELEKQPASFVSKLDTTSLQLFLHREGSQIIRTILTFFFLLLIVCVIFFASFKLVNYSYVVPRIVGLVFLLILLWVPIPPFSPLI